MNTLVRGQKLPIFSGAGLPHNRVTAQIVRQAKIVGEDVSFAIVFAAMGVKHDVARFFIDNFRETGVLENVALFLSLADAPSVERLQTPRAALTLAEYLAFRENMHVLVVLTDMTNYCEALREISTARSEIPREKLPGLPVLGPRVPVRAGRNGRERQGSITQMEFSPCPPTTSRTRSRPDGIHHRGQIVLDRELNQKGIYPRFRCFRRCRVS